MSAGQSIGNGYPLPPNVIINDHSYIENQSRIVQLRQWLEAATEANEQGNAEFNAMKQRLALQIQQGEEAKRLLEQLSNPQSNQQLLLGHAETTRSLPTPPGAKYNAPPPTNYVEYRDQTHAAPITATIEEVQSPQHPRRSPRKTQSIGASNPSNLTQQRVVQPRPEPHKKHTFQSGVQPVPQQANGWHAYGSTMQTQGAHSTSFQQFQSADPPLQSNHNQVPTTPLTPTSVPQPAPPTHYRYYRPERIGSASSSSLANALGNNPTSSVNVAQKNVESQSPAVVSTSVGDNTTQAIKTPQANHSATSIPVATNTAVMQNNAATFSSVRTPPSHLGPPQSIPKVNEQANTIPHPTIQTPKAAVQFNNQTSSAHVPYYPGPLQSIPPSQPQIIPPVINNPNAPIAPSIIHGLTTTSSVPIPQGSATPSQDGSQPPIDVSTRYFVQWALTAPPCSYLPLRGGNQQLYKDERNTVYVVAPDGNGKLRPVDSQNALAMSLAAAARSSVYQDANGKFVYLDKPLTMEQRKIYRPYFAPPASPSHPSVSSSVSATQRVGSTSLVPPTSMGNFVNTFAPQKGQKKPVRRDTIGAQVIPTWTIPLAVKRVPQRVDRTRLAEYVLRALGSPLKRSRPDDESEADRDPKRRAVESLVPGGHSTVAVPNTHVASAINGVAKENVIVKPPERIGEPITSVIQEFENTSLPIQPPTQTNLLEAPTSLTSDIIKLSELPSAQPVVASPPRSKTPLFFLSPVSSPRHTSLPMDNSESALASSEAQRQTWTGAQAVNSVAGPSRRASVGRTKVYVLIPAAPEWVIKGKQKERADRKKKQGKGQEADTEDGDDQLWGQGQSSSSHRLTVRDEDEQAALEETSSRMRERQCKWLRCHAVLNSTQNLIKHLARHVSNNEGKVLRTCLWYQCGRKFKQNELISHTASHAHNPIFCAFEDCDGTFRTPRQLLMHNIANHKNSTLRPSSEPFLPHISGPPQACPNVLPSYMVEPRRVAQSAISEERHKVLGPWVLRNIYGPVDLGPAYDASQRIQRRMFDKGEPRIQGPGFHEYDFVASGLPSTKAKKKPMLGNLDSAEVSQLLSDGYVLWPDPNVKFEEAILVSDVDELGASEDTVAQTEEEPRLTKEENVEDLRDTDRGPFVSTPMSEEDAVEFLLIED